MGPLHVAVLRRGSSFLPRHKSSDLSFRGYAKLGMFSEAGFKTDISVGEKITNVFAKYPEFILFLPLVTLSYPFSPIPDSSFTFCYSVSFSLVSQSFLH